ncbi:MAG TPA: S49 family peptidase, partial [Rhodanobacteraceae bacterium]
INKGYHDFVSRVAQARGMSYSAVDAVAQGRVWTGKQALERGLVDKLGGLHDAIAAAAGLAHLGTHYSVGYLQPKVSGFNRFMQGIGRSAAAHVLLAHGVHLPRWMAQVSQRALPDLTLFTQSKPGKPAVYAYCFCSAH